MNWSKALLLLVVLAAPVVAAPPKVAVVYSSWPEGKLSFGEEFDDELAALGWQFDKILNTDIADLVDRLGEYDLVIVSSVGNYEDPQDMTPYRDQWRAFLESGGCLLVVDASYHTVLGLWVNTFGDDFVLSTKVCVAHTAQTPESRVVTVADHALTRVPHDLEPLLLSRPLFWAHLDSWPDTGGWESLVTCADNGSLLLTRPVGKGLLVVTSYYSFKDANGHKVARALLDNLWLYSRQARTGLVVTKLQMGDVTSETGTATVTLRNLLDTPVRLSARVNIEPPQGEVIAGEPTPVLLQAHEKGLVRVPFKLGIRGAFTARLLVEDDTGQPKAELARPMTVAPVVSIQMTRKHLYEGSGRSPQAVIRMLPDSSIDRADLTIDTRVDGGPWTVLPDYSDTVQRTIQGSSPDRAGHTFTARLKAKGRTIGEATEEYFIHPRPAVGTRSDGVVLMDGEPFFPFGFYHVSQSFDREHRLKMARDIAAAGFNCAHTRVMDTEAYGPFLDECAKLGVYIVTEFSAPMFEVAARYKDHPGALAWNPGDEPTIHGTTAEEMYSRYDRFKQVDPNHLVYTVICRPSEYRNYARGTDVLAPDPYPVPNRPVTDVYRLLKSASEEAARYDTSLWGVLQCFGGYGGWKRPPTAQELRAMTYLALLAPVKGIIYYTYGDGGWVVTDHPEQWEASKALVPEIKRLAPALMDGVFELVSEGEGDIYCGYWQHEGTRHVIVVNGAEEAKPFELPMEGTTLSAPFRDEAPASLNDGKLTGELPGLDVLVLEVK